MNRIERAEALFAEKFNCSQSILAAFGPELGLDRQTALKIGGAFGAGMGRMAMTCGACTGAFMAISLKYGAVDPEDRVSREKAYETVREFRKRFEERFGSLECKAILGVDLSTPEGYKFAEERNLVKTRCPEFIRGAAEILEEIL